MLAKLRPRLTYANVVSTICLFIVLGGTAVAAGGINSIGGLQIRANAVGASEVKKNAIGEAEVKKNAIGASELKAAAVGAAELKAGAVTSADIQDKTLKLADFDVKELPPGPTGPTGPQGLKGPEGDAGATTVTRRLGTQTICTNTPTNADECVTPPATASCLAGERAVGGGGVNATTLDPMTVSEPAGPVNNPTGWTVRFADGTDADFGSNATPVVLCASP